VQRCSGAGPFHIYTKCPLCRFSIKKKRGVIWCNGAGPLRIYTKCPLCCFSMKKKGTGGSYKISYYLNLSIKLRRVRSFILFPFRWDFL